MAFLDYTGLQRFKSKLDDLFSGKLNTSLKGAANGLAELDSAGKVPSSQLPSFVDDVLEYASLGNFPLTGESGKIYIALDTNKTYRWSGSAYVEISSSLALGETSSTAYRGDRGKAAYDHATAKGSAFKSGLYKITTNAEGHVTGATAVAKSDITGLGIPAQDTKNTAGTTNKTGTKMFIAAATEQSANPQTYSNSNAYIGTDNCLYSGGAKVLTAHQDISGKKNTQSAVSDPSASGTSLTFISGISQNAQGVISPAKKTVATMGGASSSAAGSAGLVPKPKAGQHQFFLKGDGTWDGSLSTELASVENGLAYRETGATASRNISDGEYVFWKGVMYKANGNIASGATLVSGTNLTPTENALNALGSKIAKYGVRYNLTANTDTNGCFSSGLSMSGNEFPYSAVSLTTNVIVSNPFRAGDDYYYFKAENLDGTPYASASVTVSFMKRSI